MSVPQSHIDLDHVQMTNKRLLVRRLEPETKTAGGLVIPDSSQQERIVAEVVRCRPGCEIDGVPIRPGMLVMTSHWAMNSYEISEREFGQKLRVINENDLLLVVEDKPQ